MPNFCIPLPRPSRAKNGIGLGQSDNMSCSAPVLTDLIFSLLGPKLTDQIISRFGVGGFHYSAVIVLIIVFYNLVK